MLTEQEEQIRLQLVKIVKHLHCSICLNLMVNPSTTQCLHRFCHSCICQSIQSSSGDYCRCPLCNEKITKRSLREQTELSDIIESVKKVVGLFESENQLTSIMAHDEIVVFDVSTDKSRSTDDSLLEDIECIDDSNDNKTDNKSNKEEINCPKDSVAVENNKKSLPTTTIISVSDDWPTCEDSVDLTNNDIEDMTDIYVSNTSVENECSFADKSIKGLSKLEIDESTEIIANETQTDNEMNGQTDEDKSKSVLTQSQNLLFAKPKITYSTTRKSGDDLFDQIISNSKVNNNHNHNDTNAKTANSEIKSTENKDEIGVKPNGCHNQKNQIKPSKSYEERCASSETEDECEEIKMPEVNKRKPLAQLKHLQNNEKHEDKKKFKRVQRFDSSDDEDIDSPVVVNRKRKAQKIRESDVVNSVKELEVPESDIELSDDEFLMTSIHETSFKNVSVENNRKSVSFKSDDRDGYNSDEQLITSSPFSSEY